MIHKLLFGQTKYANFLYSAEGITTDVLTDRLKRLERAGLVDKQPCRSHPPRYDYRLTWMGRDLEPVFAGMVHWANNHIPATPPLVRVNAGDGR